MIDLIDITKTFGPVEAVRGISLKVRQGELMTLLGPSGSGKTTTLMMVAGHEPPDNGAILINGKEITNVPPYRRDIGMVFQQLALFPHLTVDQNIAFPLRMRKTNRRDVTRKVSHALELVRLQGLGSRFPRQLSGGQQQRVALARALVFDPSILLMDEPLSSLDKKLREDMQLEIKRLQRQLGITTLYVTHDQKEALIISDRVVVFNSGSIEQVGSPDELYERPRNEFVADFIGESNFLTARIATVNGTYCEVVTEDGLSLRALVPESVSPGEEITVAVRPESISLEPLHASEQFNQVSGLVEEVTYYGEGIRAIVNINRKASMVLKQENTGVHMPLTCGQKIQMSWSWSKTNVLKRGRVDQ